MSSLFQQLPYLKKATYHQKFDIYWISKSMALRCIYFRLGVEVSSIVIKLRCRLFGLSAVYLVEIGCTPMLHLTSLGPSLMN
jgi:hypothetical protein